MKFEELMEKSTKQWDGYRTISQDTARKISVTGKVPKEGCIVKSKINWPSGVGKMRNTRENVYLPESEMWISWTTYRGKRVLYIY